MARLGLIDSDVDLGFDPSIDVVDPIKRDCLILVLKALTTIISAHGGYDNVSLNSDLITTKLAQSHKEIEEGGELVGFDKIIARRGSQAIAIHFSDPKYTPLLKILFDYPKEAEVDHKELLEKLQNFAKHYYEAFSYNGGIFHLVSGRENGDDSKFQDDSVKHALSLGNVSMESVGFLNGVGLGESVIGRLDDLVERVGVVGGGVGAGGASAGAGAGAGAGIVGGAESVGVVLKPCLSKSRLEEISTGSRAATPSSASGRRERGGSAASLSGVTTTH